MGKMTELIQAINDESDDAIIVATKGDTVHVCIRGELDYLIPMIMRMIEDFTTQSNIPSEVFLALIVKAINAKKEANNE